MTVEQELAVIVVALYLFECTTLVKAGSQLVASFGIGAFRFVREVQPIGSYASGLVFKAPPMGLVIVCDPERALPGPDELANGTAYSAIRECYAIDGVLKVNGETLAVYDSPRQARRIAELIQELSSMSPERREKRLRRRARQMLDIESARARAEALDRGAYWSVAAGSGVFAFLVVALTMTAFGLGKWVTVLGGLALFWPISVWIFVRSHKRLYPDGGRARRANALMACVSPFHAARLHDALYRHAFEGFHPLAVCAALCADFEQVAGQAIRELVFDRSEHGQAARNIWIDAIKTMMREMDLDPDAALLPPAKADARVLAYCPRCWAQYHKEGECTDCEGMALARFDR